MNAHLSLHRTLAVFIKEFQQMLRDRLTFAMAVGVPVLQLLLFGYAINTDPKGLPTVLVAADNGPLVRSFIASLQNTGYFRITETAASERDGEALIERGQAQFMVAIPPQFSRALLRGERPALLVAVDATDPSASGNAIAALALHRLAFLTGETRFSDAAAGTIALFLPQVERYPGSFGTMLAALEEQVEPPRTLILRGDPAEFAPWRAWLDKAYLPTTLVLFIPANAAPLPEPLAKPPKPGVNAWLCEGVTCLTPIDDADRLREALKIPKIAAPT